MIIINNLKFFIYNESKKRKNIKLSKDFFLSVFEPTGLSINPINSWSIIFFIYRILYFFRIISKYYIYIVYCKKTKVIVHHSLVQGKNFKFPFMKKHDYQIGFVWTNELFRGRKIANFVLIKILNDFINYKIWYISESKNIASIKCAVNSGFKFYNNGFVYYLKYFPFFKKYKISYE